VVALPNLGSIHPGVATSPSADGVEFRGFDRPELPSVAVKAMEEVEDSVEVSVHPHEEAQADSAQDVDEEVSARENAKRAADRLSKIAVRHNLDLRISEHQGEYVVELVDRDSGDVVRRIPPEEYDVRGPEYRSEGKEASGLRAGVLIDRNL